MNEIKLTDDQKNILIGLVNDETKKWYLLFTEEDRLKTMSQSDRCNVAKYFSQFTTLFFHLTGKDWYEELKY
jgi:hypothetical protein